jgi:hypothetical protein
MVAPIVVTPGEMVFAVPAEFTVATPGEDELQVTEEVTSWVEPSV